MFFLLITLAGLTSCISIFEVPISFMEEEFHISRRSAVIYSCLWAMGLGIVCSLSLGIWSDFTLSLPKVGTPDHDVIFDFLDHLTSRYMMPICALLTSLFVGWWLDRDIIHNAVTNWKTDSGWYLRPLLWLLRIVAPLGILVIFLSGIGVI